MSDPPSPSADLEQLLRDERALRIRAEARAAEQANKAETWRIRAEERAARIEQITTDSRRFTRRRRRAKAPPPERTVPPDSSPEVHGPARLATVRAATALDSRYDTLISQFAVEPLAARPAALAEADVAIVATTAIASLPVDAQERFSGWLRSPARQPLIVIADGVDPDPGLASHAAALLAPVQADSPGVQILDPVFDPKTDNPIGYQLPQPMDPRREVRDGITAVMDRDELVGVELFDGTAHYPSWVISAAARGVPVTSGHLDFGDLAALARAATTARRWAFRNHTPSQRSAQLLDFVGISAPNPDPTAAGILVSMRPDEAAGAVTMLAKQTYRPFSIVVGLHGAAPTAALEDAIGGVPPDIPVTTIPIPDSASLGEALNRAIEVTGAEILAKIDDDDFYGPCHIEDGVHALDYSAAGIVGKGAQFTYVEEEHRTVLRRQREEETIMGGSPTGATMLFRRSVWEPIGFPHRPRQVDVLFTTAARRNGAVVYANSRWEFCYVRRQKGHTWTAAASTFLTGADPMWDGFQPELAVVPSLPDPVRSW